MYIFKILPAKKKPIIICMYTTGDPFSSFVHCYLLLNAIVNYSGLMEMHKLVKAW